MNKDIEILINTVNTKITPFGLPLICIGENLEEDEIRKRIDNIEKYIDIIIKFTNNIIDNGEAMYETHHILPKGLGGTDDMSNLVNLPVKEHILCHIYLSLAYPGNIPMVTAAWFMTSLKKETAGNSKNRVQKLRQQVIESELDIETIAFCRENYLKMKKTKEWHDAHSGIHAPNFGRKFSDETRRRIGVASGKRRHTEESKKKMSRSKKGEKNWAYGKKVPDEQREKISSSVKALWKDNPELFDNCTVKVISPDGVIFDSIQKAADAYGLKAVRLRQLLNKNLDRKGWKYLDPKRERLREEEILKHKSVKNKGFHEVISPDGIVFPSIKDAATSAGVNYSALRIRLQRLHQRLQKNSSIDVKNKWRYIEDDK